MDETFEHSKERWANPPTYTDLHRLHRGKQSFRNDHSTFHSLLATPTPSLDHKSTHAGSCPLFNAGSTRAMLLDRCWPILAIYRFDFWEKALFIEDVHRCLFSKTCSSYKKAFRPLPFLLVHPVSALNNTEMEYMPIYSRMRSFKSRCLARLSHMNLLFLRLWGCPVANTIPCGTLNVRKRSTW